MRFLIKDEDSKRARKLQNSKPAKYWKKGKASGWAFPITIPSINHLIGTKYLPDVNGSIMFLDIPEGNSINEGLSIADFDSFLTDIDNSNLLSKIHGLIIGKPYRYSNGMIDELRSVILRVCKKYDFPILFGVNIGHTDPMITIPIGSNINMGFSNTEVLSITRTK